jgi:hypothetical protein
MESANKPIEQVSETVSLDKVNVEEKINELTNNLEQIEKSVNEIAETKDAVAEVVAPVVEAVAPVVEAVAPVVEAVVPVAEVVVPVVEAVAPVVENTVNVVTEVLGETVPPLNELSLIVGFINEDGKLPNLMDKLSIRPDAKTQKSIDTVFKFLSTANVKFDNSPPIKNIVDEIKKLFSAGKLNLYDIPSLINIVVDVLNLNLSGLKIQVDTNLVGLVIKLIIHILISLEIIHTGEAETASIDRLIDSSIALLNTSIAISKAKCSLFACCGKK